MATNRLFCLFFLALFPLAILASEISDFIFIQGQGISQLQKINLENFNSIQIDKSVLSPYLIHISHKKRKLELVAFRDKKAEKDLQIN